MKIETELTADHQAKLTVEVEAERLESNKQRAATKLSKRVKIPGFRPGKAPYAVIVRNLGEDAILEEALNQLIEEVYPEVIKEAEIKPYGPGNLDKVPSMDPLVLEFTIPLDAEVTLGDYKSIRRPYEPEPVADEKVSETLRSLQENQAVLEPVERAAEAEDVVSLKIDAHFIGEDDGEFIEDHSSHLLVRSEPDVEEWPFDGFSKLLAGKLVGDQDTVTYSYPDDYSEENLKGKTVEFTFKVESIKSRTLPDLDDEFAKSIGDFENIEVLRENVVASLKQQSEEAYNQAYDEKVIDEIIEQSTFKYPPQMLDDEIHQSIKDLESRLARQSLNLDIYLKARNIDHEALHEEIRPEAEQRLKTNLLLFEIGKSEEIHIEPEELQMQAGSTLNYLQQVLPEKEARRLNERNVQSNVINNVMVDLLKHKTIERIRMIANGKQEELEAAAEAEEEKVNELAAAESNIAEPEQEDNSVSEETPTAE